MAFNGFRFGVIARVLFIAVLMFAAVWLAMHPEFRFSAAIVGIMAIIAVLELIRYVERTNRRITQFLESIRHADFTSTFSDKGMGKSFKRLSEAFTEVINEFKKNRAEKEEHFNYLQTVVQHISIGIIAFRSDGKVDMQNHAVRRLLGTSPLRNISELGTIKKSLPESLLQMKAGDRSLIKVFVENELLQLSIYATEFRLRNESYVLVSLQNIHSELEEKEIESWQKLIRVLTHEIMNSITPISSLASTVTDMLIDNEGTLPIARELDQEDVQNVHDALMTIQNRSRGLLNFVEIYRNLTRIPKPNFRYFPVTEVLDRLQRLMKPRLIEQNVSFSFRASPPDLMLTADPDLIDQVFINLMLNALDALKGREEGKIGIEAYANKNGRITVDIIDNGSGIKPDIIDKIFMPFFTSKKEGSGIGLSLSRQIMQLHKGSISVKSKPEEGTVFSLTF
ncbi:MAG TPA: ATP-binding protein [Bacteroidales bacterium]|nr:MAG: hypothetical protein A2X11_04320 [Bacteroidetes bacterium GWE2_42_24]OFY25247.1 MAG: hypothetical protein A2X09_10975 [Bacteroidetes bacterium GWF2_43_11]HAQ65932.1 ATP-binding protein [Bacteroidales bacterium]HBZ66948.1 ATP-binding protein [Bacteroidales bacterium]